MKELKNKAFTLIELLTIIVILAIIAVITVPVILNIIDNSRKGAVIDSAYGYKDSIQKYYLSKVMNDTTQELPTRVYSVASLPEDFTVSGEKPTEGWVQLANGQVVDYSLKFDDYVVNYDENTNLPVAIKNGVVEDKPNFFATDSWSNIKENLQFDKNYYAIGSEREVEIDVNGDGTNESYTVRLSNTSTPDECNTSGFSQTACGVVIEFVDVIVSRYMNSKLPCEKGWPASNMYSYLNDDNNTNDTVSIYEKLPSDLKNVIIDTFVVSGHEKDVTDNYTSTDKLYLLSYVEVWGGNSTYDSVTTTSTKQLEYYKKTESTRIKKTIEDATIFWWLRSKAYTLSEDTYDDFFIRVNHSGNITFNSSTGNSGVAPAFRIAE